MQAINSNINAFRNTHRDALSQFVQRPEGKNTTKDIDPTAVQTILDTDNFTSLTPKLQSIAYKLLQQLPPTALSQEELGQFAINIKNRNETYNHLIDSNKLNEKDTTSGSVKLAKYMSNEIRTQTTKTFLTTVADAMTTFIGNTNTGVQAKIDIGSMTLMSLS